VPAAGFSRSRRTESSVPPHLRAGFWSQQNPILAPANPFDFSVRLLLRSALRAGA